VTICLPYIPFFNGHSVARNKNLKKEKRRGPELRRGSRKKKTEGESARSNKESTPRGRRFLVTNESNQRQKKDRPAIANRKKGVRGHPNLKGIAEEDTMNRFGGPPPRFQENKQLISYTGARTKKRGLQHVKKLE